MIGRQGQSRRPLLCFSLFLLLSVSFSPPLFLSPRVRQMVPNAAQETGEDGPVSPEKSWGSHATRRQCMASAVFDAANETGG